MGIWTKKLKVDEKKVEEEPVKTEVLRAELDKSEVSEQVSPKVAEKELSSKEKEAIELIKWYNENYSLFYGMGDVIQLPEAHIKAEQLNLLFGILCELKKMNDWNIEGK